MPMLAELVDVVIGVDTHKHTHTAAVIDAGTGAVLEHATVATTPAGYADLVEMADRHSSMRAWSIEGTGTYGAGLTRQLRSRNELVVELDRPNRPARRGGAKSDEIDAVRAGREALAREHLTDPRAAGDRAALQVLITARRSAVDAAVVAQQQMLALITSSPETLRSRFRDLSTHHTLRAAARLRVSGSWDVETRTYAETIRGLARRAQAMNAEAAEHQRSMHQIIQRWRPDLLEVHGVGPIVAAIILCSWSHPGRCRSDAAFASLAGVAPLPASSGMTTRHRLSRSGDRQLNRAIHVIMLSRVRYDSETRDYIDRRRTEGKTDREIKRCLKRYIARQIYRQLEHPPT